MEMCAVFECAGNKYANELTFLWRFVGEMQ